jgi:hypothetical protein
MSVNRLRANAERRLETKSKVVTVIVELLKHFGNLTAFRTIILKYVLRTYDTRMCVGFIRPGGGIRLEWRENGNGISGCRKFGEYIVWLNKY